MLFKTTLAGLLATITKLVARLEAHAEASLAKADQQSAVAMAAVTKSNEHAAEAGQALRVASKVRELIS